MDPLTELRQENEGLKKLTASQAAKIEQLQLELMLAMHRMWGRSAEKFEPQGPLLFDELAEAGAPSEESAVEDEKKPSNRGRKPLSSHLVRKHHHHDLPASDRMCPCGKCMVKIGEDTNEKLNMIPAQVWVDCKPQFYPVARFQGRSDTQSPDSLTAGSFSSSCLR